MPTLSLDELNGGNSLGALIWQSGRIVRQWEAVVSPMDGEVYRRKTATGSGTVDPSADTTNYRAASYSRVLSQANAWADGSITPCSYFVPIGTGRMSIPAFTAGERKLALSLTGRGVIRFLLVMAAGTGTPVTTARTELIIDGRTVFNAVQQLNTSSNQFYWCPVGAVTSTAAPSVAAPGQLDFRLSAQVYITSNVSQSADRFGVHAMYEGYES